MMLNNKNRLLSQALNIILFLTVIIINTKIDHLSKPIERSLYVLILLLFIIYFIYNIKEIRLILQKQKIMMALMVLLPLWAFILGIFRLGGSGIFVLLFILTFPFITIVSKNFFDINKKLLLTALVLSAIITLTEIALFKINGTSVLGVSSAGFERINLTFHNYISSEIIATIFAVLSLYICLKISKKISFKLLFFICFAIFTVTCFMTAARGPIIALIATILVMIMFSIKGIKSLIIVIMIVVISYFLIVNNDTTYNKRFKESVQGVSKALNKNFTLDSANIRVQMFQVSLACIKTHPFIGCGELETKNIKENMIANGLIAENILNFKHYESDFLNVVSETGLIGFIFWLLLWFILFKMSIQKTKDKDGIFNLSSTLLLIIFTNSILNSFIFYTKGLCVFIVVLIIAMVLKSEKKLEQ